VHMFFHIKLGLSECTHMLSHVMLGLSDCAHVLSHYGRPVRMHTHAVTCDARSV
jgi:hypothetical protein